MPLFRIDQTKCKRDGICVAECPSQIIVQKDKKSFPELMAGGDEYCIDCGHCVAVCPHGAFILNSMPPAACEPLDKNLLPDAPSLKHLLQARRSIRTYQKKTVSRKIISELIEAAHYAPTASNKQQVHWIIFQDPDEVQRLAAMVIDFMKQTLSLAVDEAAADRYRRIIRAWDSGVDRIMRGAPHLVVAHSPSDTSFPEADCAHALAYLELYAFARGLGTCWAGYFTAAANAHGPLIHTLDLPAGHRCYGAVMLGYPRYKYKRIPAREEAKLHFM